MAARKKIQKRTSEIAFEEFSEARLKNIMRFLAFGNFSDDYALKYINSGVLGFKLDKNDQIIVDKDNKPVPVTIGRTKYYEYKKQMLQQVSINAEFTEFAKTKYSQEILNILSLLKELQSKSIDNFNRTMNDPVANQKIIDSITKNLPAYTQYMDVLKRMQKHGRLPGGVTPPEEQNETLVKTD